MLSKCAKTETAEFEVYNITKHILAEERLSVNELSVYFPKIEKKTTEQGKIINMTKLWVSSHLCSWPSGS